MVKILTAVISMLFASCNNPWTGKDKEEFYGGCVKGALKDMTEDKAKSYCNCMLEKVQKRYPNVSALKYIRADTALYSIANECRK